MLSIQVILARAGAATVLSQHQFGADAVRKSMFASGGLVIKRPSINYRESRGKMIKGLEDSI